MALKGRVCTRGIWDETIPGISFDDNGVSNYAKLFDKLCEAYPRGEKGKKDWEKIVSEIKNKSKGKKYDCIVGVSGGTDSCYLLHLLKKEYKVNPLAVNLDNGWNSDIAVKNIKKITEQLNIDLVTYVIDYEEIKDLNRCFMLAGIPWIDAPTDLAIKSVLYEIASKEGIKYIFRGNDFRSEGSQPNEWTGGDGKTLKFLHKKFGRVKLKTFPNYTLAKLLYFSIIKGIKTVYPYYYLDYDKKLAQEFLKTNYSWEYYGEHHHENLFTKYAISYWLYEKFNIDKRKITYSAQILSGQITRGEAIEIVNKLPYEINKINEMTDFLIKKLDFSKDEYYKIFSSKNCSYLDYPSYDALMKKYLILAKPILKFIFIHKPQSIFQFEMRNNKK